MRYPRRLQVMEALSTVTTRQGSESPRRHIGASPSPGARVPRFCAPPSGECHRADVRPLAGPARSPALPLSDLPPQERLRILTAALDVFAAHGYAGTTTAHLQAQIDPEAFNALF